MEGIAELLSHLSPALAQRRVETAAREASRAELMESLRETSRRLSAVRSCFDNEINDDLMDSYILELDALERRYGYLLKKAKREKINNF